MNLEYSSSENNRLWKHLKSHETKKTFNVRNQNWIVFVTVAVTDAEYYVLCAYVLKPNVHVFDSFAEQDLPKASVIEKEIYILIKCIENLLGKSKRNSEE